MSRMVYRTDLLFVLALLPLSCTVPDLNIVERASVSEAPDASAAGSDEGADGVKGRARRRDSETELRTGAAPAAGATAPNNGREAGTGADAGRSSSGAAGAAGAGESAGTVGQAGTSGPSAGGMGGSAGALAPTEQAPQPTRACLVWTSINIRNGPPAGAIEAGFETIGTVTTRQYICRMRPPGSTYAIPGKYVDRLGCYVVERRDGQVNDVSVLEGVIDVLVPGPGCSFSWRAAIGGELPQSAVDLGDPADGRNYACRGDNSSIGAPSMQVGTLIASTDNPALYQCWFESFSNAIQPKDPMIFEVLVQDPQ